MRFFLTLCLMVGGSLQASPPVRLVSPQKETAFRQALPVVESQEIMEILQADDLIFYTEEEIPRAYQHGNTFHTPYYNISGEPDPFGNGNREFPWNQAGGAHEVSNLEVFRFVQFPRREGGGWWPMVYFNQQLPVRHRDGLMASTWRWRFPDGTVFGELLGMRLPNGYSYPFELRFRIREGDQWAVECFRPFPRASDLADRIKEVRPEWGSDQSLIRLVNHLEGSFRFGEARLRDHSGRAFDETNLVDVLPPVPDQDLVASLLVETVWKTALGEDWRDSEQGRVHAPAVRAGAGFHIVPERYAGYAFAVDRENCMQCHAHTNRAVASFSPNRGWYGRIRGSDGIFSFHPVAKSSIATNGANTPVRINPTLSRAGLVERYDPSRHPAEMYPRLDPEIYQEGR